MNIRKYWLDAEIYIYAIDDDDQRTAHPTKTDYYIARNRFGEFRHVFGLFDDSNYPENEAEFIDTLHTNGYFDADIEELCELV